MSHKTITVMITAFATVAIGIAWNVSDARAGLRGRGIGQTGCTICCPVCDHVCQLDAKQVDEDKTCFEVECKTICIPRVVFPWQKKKCLSCDSCDGVGCNNCVHNGARVRRIRVLKTEKYKCPKCEYKWTAQPCDAGCDTCCDSGCDVTSSTAVPYRSDQPMSYRELTPTPEPIAPGSALPPAPVPRKPVPAPVPRVPVPPAPAIQHLPAPTR